MKAVFALFAIGMPTFASAQAFQPPAPYVPYVDVARGIDVNYSVLRPYNDNDTPTMRQQKLRRSIALRQEVAELVREDGGTLSEAHRYYVRRKVRNIRCGC